MESSELFDTPATSTSNYDDNAAMKLSIVPVDANEVQLPPKPDRTKHDAIKAKYKVLQKKHTDVMAVRSRSTLNALREILQKGRAKLRYLMLVPFSNKPGVG